MKQRALKYMPLHVKTTHSFIDPFCRVGQNHTFIGTYGVYTVFLAGKSPYIRSCTVCMYGSGQPSPFASLMVPSGPFSCHKTCPCDMPMVCHKTCPWTFILPYNVPMAFFLAIRRAHAHGPSFTYLPYSTPLTYNFWPCGVTAV
jgi:hypothetical protein